MPRLGLTMEEGTVVKWLKKEGESFQKGEPIVEIMSDKTTTVVEAAFTGVLTRIIVSEDQMVPVSSPIAEADTTVSP